MKKTISRMAGLLVIGVLMSGCSSLTHIADGTPVLEFEGHRSDMCVYASRAYNVGSQINAAGHVQQCGYSKDVSGDNAMWIVVGP